MKSISNLKENIKDFHAHKSYSEHGTLSMNKRRPMDQSLQLRSLEISQMMTTELLGAICSQALHEYSMMTNELQVSVDVDSMRLSYDQ